MPEFLKLILNIFQNFASLLKMSKGKLIARVQKLLGGGMKDNIEMVETLSLVKKQTYRLTSNAINWRQAEEICAGHFCLAFEPR